MMVGNTNQYSSSYQLVKERLIPTEPDRLVDALAHSAFHTMGVLTRVGAEHDLSLTQLRVLAILRDREGLRMSALADYLGLERSTLSGLVDRAEARDLLVRSKDPADGRAFVVALGPAGVRLAEEVVTQLRALLADSLEPLDDSERVQLRSLLERSIAADPDR